ncbi:MULTISPECIES: alkaline phosphatase [Massilia]|uniref:Alkaline phosphatase family protein n=2 Tax=Massilia timonae TaxID=47229 RepID=A0A1S2N3V0_9BURK|nr:MULTISPECIES: alkaline phosphatase [Massilia]OIJ39757.1 alkaline phosphatase family protein [Massilia timonae]QYF99763.1 alkaline phosphatase [Massilia sp. NP310]
MRPTTLASAALLAALAGCATTPPASNPSTAATAQGVNAVDQRAKNVIFFLGDGMGINTLTAARIFAAGEDGELAIDKLPESAFVKTFSNDAQVTDSAASMAAYMTGVKQNNNVVSMSFGTRAIAPGKDANGNALVSRCENGTAAVTLLELAKRRGMAVGVVTNTSVTDATPASTYAHACHRKLETDIAASLVPGGAGYNPALGARGLDVLFGGGAQHFTPFAKGGKRADNRDLLAELGSKGFRVVSDTAQFDALQPGQPAVGLFAPNHMNFDATRDPARQPALPAMATKAIDLLASNKNGFFLMIEGGLIDHALHATLGKRALQETVTYNAALQAAIDRMEALDPGLKHTLIVATADHDHTLILNGYAARTGKTTPTNPGVIGLVRNADGKPALDGKGQPYTIIGFGTGEQRHAGDRTAHLTDEVVTRDDYHQEAVVRTRTGAETHGGSDVYLGATGANAELFRGTIDNTRVFNLIKTAAGL